MRGFQFILIGSIARKLQRTEVSFDQFLDCDVLREFSKAFLKGVVFEDSELGLSFGSIPLVAALRIIERTLRVVDTGLKATVVTVFGDFER